MDDVFPDLSPSVSSTQGLDLDFLCSKEGYEHEEFDLLTPLQYPEPEDTAPPEDPDSGGSSSSKSFVECRVCGDKASGYHYGVTSCEGCKGFFRRSIQKQISYKCLREKHCLVIRQNRNRCQYCRFRKCLDVGMSKDSVRYGRVPKKSRLKETDSSTMYDIIVSIAEAHQVHCAYTEERTRSLVRKPALFSLGDQQQLDGYPGSNLELQKLLMWQQFASMMTPSIPQVVEFAKRIPGFSDLHPDDQLLCVKFGFFEVWCVYAARLAREGTLSFYDGTCLTAHQLEIIFDRDFVNQIFGFMQWLNELQLSDTEIAMFSAMVLLNAERGGVSNPKSVQQLQSRVTEALQLRETRLQGLSRLLVSRLADLRALSQTHANHLCWFRQQWPHLRLPALFAEVFDFPTRPADLSR